MDYETIYDWTAKRAGGAITVTGKTYTGNPRKITKVDYLTVSDGPELFPVAVGGNGTRYRLALTPRLGLGG